jgi:hypothetical protein
MIVKTKDHRPWKLTAYGTARRTLMALSMATTAVIALNTLAPAAYGQASSSSDIAGKVTDATGASIP